MGTLTRIFKSPMMPDFLVRCYSLFKDCGSGSITNNYSNNNNTYHELSIHYVPGIFKCFMCINSYNLHNKHMS